MLYTLRKIPLVVVVQVHYSPFPPAGLLAQLVEHCTSIAEVMGSNPIQARIFFFQVLFQLLVQ